MYSYEAFVGISKVGADGKLTLGAMLDYFQDCEWQDIMTEPVLSEFFNKNKAVIFLIYRQVDIFRRPSFAEKLFVKTWAFDVTPILGYRNTSICDKSGNICIASYIVGSFVNLETGKPIKVPKEILGSISIAKKLDMDYQPRKIVNHDTRDEIQNEIKVWKFFVDANGHMNNATYAELAEEYIPDEYEVKRIRMEYMTPAKRFDSLIPSVYHLNSGVIGVKLASDTGKEYARIEFS